MRKKTKQLDIDAYRAELESLDDDQLFEEGELEHLREEAKSELIEDYVSDYEDELDEMDLAGLYGKETWDRKRAAKVEELLKERLRGLEQGGQ